MAPLDPLSQVSLENLRRQDGMAQDISLSKRARDDGNGPGHGRPKDFSPGGNGNGNGRGGGGGEGGGGGGGARKGSNSDSGASNANTDTATTGSTSLILSTPASSTSSVSSSDSPSATIIASPPPSVPAAAATTTPLAVVATSTTPDPVPTIIPSVSPLIPTLFPTTVLPDPSATQAFATSTSSSPRKAIDPAKDHTSIDGTTGTDLPVPTTTIVIPQSALIPTPLPSHDPKNGSDSKSNNFHGSPKGSKNNNNGLSPTAEGLLIAAGAIGAFVIVLAGVYLFLRVKNVDVFGPVRNRRIHKGGDRGLYGWRRNRPNSPSEAPPQYDGSAEFLSEEKEYLPQREFVGNYAPAKAPGLAAPQTADELSSTNLPPQRLTREALLENPAILGFSSPGMVIPEPDMSYNNTGRRNTLLSRKASSANNNNTTGTQDTSLTRQTSNLRNTNEGRELNHMSYLSSLSSGFGDGLIMSEVGAPSGNQGRVSQNPPRMARFSWMQQPAVQKGNRDTVYTTTSEESAPRFRTITSWVAQQTGNMEKRAPLNSNPPDILAVPPTLRVGEPAHHRNVNENPVFQFHPGEEVQISRGSRVPSEILNKKTGIN